MLEKIEGTVSSYRSITKRNVQFELNGIPKVIDLTVSDSWVINKGDLVTVAGEVDSSTGKFIGYAYYNKSKGVRGKFDARSGVGVVFVIAGIIFCWAIFPLFTHIPAGLKLIALGKKVSQAELLI